MKGRGEKTENSGKLTEKWYIGGRGKRDACYKDLSCFISAVADGKVEKTDPRSADCPLTPASRTTLRTGESGKSLKKLWCCVGGKCNEIIGFY